MIHSGFQQFSITNFFTFSVSELSEVEIFIIDEYLDLCWRYTWRIAKCLNEPLSCLVVPIVVHISVV